MYVCNNCWNESLKWAGQCSFCKEWNTLVEFKESKIISTKSLWVKKTFTKISDTSVFEQEKIPTLSNEFNNLLWGWITKGSIILLSGEPWIGKSTLSLQIAHWIEWSVVYISWEENESQIIARANRLWVKNEHILLLCENNLENILQSLQWTKNDLVIIDSISVLTSENVNGASWGINQIKETTEKLVEFWKNSQTTIILIWHVTKDGNLAWPKTLEHLVDTVLYFEGERYEDLRILRSFKNRFWSTGEIALFQMKETGLVDVSNPWWEFLSKENNDKTTGSSLSITMEWTRPLLVEIEWLAIYTKFGYPKRSTRWIAPQKLDLILAVLWKYSKINLDSFDAYINIVRWMKVNEPWIDVSICASIISSKIWKPIPRDTVFLWEISLTWRLKHCIHLEKRIKEALKLWFKNIIIPDVEVKEQKNIKKIPDITALVAYIVW